MITRLLTSRFLAGGAALLLALLPQTAFAQDLTAGGGLEFLNVALAGVFGFLIVILAFFSIIFAMFAGELMSSTYIFGSGMGPTLQLVWEVLRNFVNIAFILILLVIAVMIVLGIGEDNVTGQMKKLLPKFIIALVVVNFTFFGARFLLTTTDVLATAVFAIPRTVSPEATIKGLPCADTPDIVTMEDCFKDIRGTMAPVVGGETDKKDTSGTDSEAARQATNQLFKIMAELGNNTTDDWVLGNVDKTSFPLALLMNLMDLKQILWVQTAAANSAADSWGIFIAALGSFITTLISAIVIFMIFMAFLVRVVVLWVLIAISPLAALVMVLKEVFPNLPGGDSNLMDEFVKNAFMPVFVAVPLSLGMVMIFANNSLTYFDGSINSLGDISGNLNALLWWIAAITIIWMGTNKAIQASGEYAQKATNGIHDFMNGAASSTASLLQYAPILPIGTGKAMLQSPGIALRRREAEISAQAEKFADNLYEKKNLSADQVNSNLQSATNISDVVQKSHSGSRQTDGRVELTEATIQNLKKLPGLSLIADKLNAGMTHEEVIHLIQKNQDNLKLSQDDRTKLKQTLDNFKGVQNSTSAEPPAAPVAAGIDITHPNYKDRATKSSGEEFNGNEVWQIDGTKYVVKGKKVVGELSGASGVEGLIDHVQLSPSKRAETGKKAAEAIVKYWDVLTAQDINKKIAALSSDLDKKAISVAMDDLKKTTSGDQKKKIEKVITKLGL